jgi:hypothetical protein
MKSVEIRENAPRRFVTCGGGRVGILVLRCTGMRVWSAAEAAIHIMLLLPFWEIAQIARLTANGQVGHRSTCEAGVQTE